MEDIDKNGDGFIDLEEYIGEAPTPAVGAVCQGMGSPASTAGCLLQGTCTARTATPTSPSG